MRVIAVDPGFGRCGVAILEKTSGRETYLCSTCIETSPQNEFPVRLAAVVDEIAALIDAHQPAALAMETLFFSNNQKTAMQVAEVRGAILYAAARSGLPVFEYGPGQVKSATTGNGSADKRQVASMLRRLLNITKDIERDDEYDAIAVGVTHLARHR